MEQRNRIPSPPRVPTRPSPWPEATTSRWVLGIVAALIASGVSSGISFALGQSAQSGETNARLRAMEQRMERIEQKLDRMDERR